MSKTRMGKRIASLLLSLVMMLSLLPTTVYAAAGTADKNGVSVVGSTAPDAAQEEGAQIAMFGHTHQPIYEQVGGVQVLNPGSSGKGRNPTWAIVEIFDNGGIICSIKEL